MSHAQAVALMVAVTPMGSIAGVVTRQLEYARSFEVTLGRSFFTFLALLEVIFGIALAWLGANEVPVATALAGGTLMIGALVVNELPGWRRRNV